MPILIALFQRRVVLNDTWVLHSCMGALSMHTMQAPLLVLTYDNYLFGQQPNGRQQHRSTAAMFGSTLPSDWRVYFQYLSCNDHRIVALLIFVSFISVPDVEKKQPHDSEFA